MNPEEVIEAAREGGMAGIEWGGDVHVPPGEPLKAAEISRRTREAGITVSSYGSYYTVGEDDNFESVLETAIALEAPLIRVWPGRQPSAECNEDYFNRVVEDTKRIAGVARRERIGIAFEKHGGSLTDTLASTKKLLSACGKNAAMSYWQPEVHAGFEENMECLRSLVSDLAYLHVFKWLPDERLSLEEGMQEWRIYLQTARQAAGQRYALLEFVKDDDREQFLRDAQTLNRLLEEQE
jgi:sugar phosphate isomerase/epimerase